MRVSFSPPGQFTHQTEIPYVSVTWEWEEARQLLEELRDDTTVFRNTPVITEELVAELTKVFNNE